jgi:hypothetical protein
MGLFLTFSRGAPAIAAKGRCASEIRIDDPLTSGPHFTPDLHGDLDERIAASLASKTTSADVADDGTTLVARRSASALRLCRESCVVGKTFKNAHGMSKARAAAERGPRRSKITTARDGETRSSG